MTVKVKKKLGRPTNYTEELADLICMRVATNPVGLPTLCEMYADLPPEQTIREWRYLHNSFAAKYAKAKLDQADLLAEKTLSIASQRPVYFDAGGNQLVDSGYIAANRLEIDTLKWHASKLLPRQYGKAAEETKSEAAVSLVEQLLNKIK